MATKDERPGLLSKVAMFVRNPTKDWSELDQQGDNDAGGYDKQALKAMIERKRQNDFVRKREFDQLRKLRDRDPTTIANLARNSFFQNSLPSDLGGRAVTLKKIDEIEAQMSRQWWKSKNGTLGQPPGTIPHAATTLPPGAVPQSEPSDSDLSAPFAATQPVDFGRNGDGNNDEFIPTQMASDIHSVPGHDLMDGPSRTHSEGSFSTSRLFAIEVDNLETDPELEEGAIRFANSDDAGAEKGLLEALRGKATDPQLAQSWVGALLDLYRATNNRDAFETAVQRFAPILDGVKPHWFALGDAAAADAAADTGTLQRIWESPAVLNADAMERLRAAMVSQPMPWYLGWGALEQIAPDAVALLDALFSSLCEESVSLRFDGEDRLVRALRTLTPSGNREVSESGWQARLNTLRVMGLQDDFELAALDFCVTFGVAPPAWVEPRCHFESHDAQADADDGVERTRPTGLRGASNPGQGLQLRGHIMGDAALALSALNAAPLGDQAVVINCRDLIRVDFAAAGSILNWVVMRQAEGAKVQFEEVHRLVAAFFNVIGINEHAKVILRAI